MRVISLLVIAAAVSLAGCSSFQASSAKKADEHEGHHPAGQTEPKVDPAKVDQQKKTMQEMHQKMMAAKTPAERAALMKDHMKAMQDGMVMMGQMSGGMPMQGEGKSSMPAGPSMQKEMMQRMDMMDMMMQMMVDREAARPPAVR